MPKKYTDFACDTCGWGGEQPCVVGKVGSRVWLEQIPLKQWHAARRNKLKDLKRQVKDNTHHGAAE